MTEPRTSAELQPESDRRKGNEVSPGTEANTVATGQKAAVDELTPEEQMARFEKELKEDDWGHQPC